MSMSIVTLTSSSNTNMSQTLPTENKNHLREASFSSYWKGSEDTFVLNLAETNKNLGSSFSTSQEHSSLARKISTEDREIDVFSAEKYFNEEVDDTTNMVPKKPSSQQHKKDDAIQIFPVRGKARTSTPSIRSESSWNSKSAFINNISKNQQHGRNKKARGKSFFANFGCNCACNDQNSVDACDSNGDNFSVRSLEGGLYDGKTKKTIKNGDKVGEVHSGSWHGNEQFNSQDFNPKAGNQAVKLKLQEEEESTRRRSLEVFGSPVLEKGKNSLDLERRLAMLSWDAIAPKLEGNEKIQANSNGLYDDACSDASSDLFEIESLSTNTTGNPFLADGMSNCITPTTCYAPSEASIEWSVVTASAADFSVLSDSEELRSTRTTNPSKVVQNVKRAQGKDTPKPRPSISLGCKNHKAVRVVGDAHQPNEKGLPNARKCQRSESFRLMTRFHNENKLAGFDNVNSQHSFRANSMPLSVTRRAAHLVYT